MKSNRSRSWLNRSWFWLAFMSSAVTKESCLAVCRVLGTAKDSAGGTAHPFEIAIRINSRKCFLEMHVFRTTGRAMHEEELTHRMRFIFCSAEAAGVPDEEAAMGSTNCPRSSSARQQNTVARQSRNRRGNGAKFISNMHGPIETKTAASIRRRCFGVPTMARQTPDELIQAELAKLASFIAREPPNREPLFRAALPDACPTSGLFQIHVQARHGLTQFGRGRDR